MPSKPPRKAPPTAPGRPAARPRPLPGVSVKGLPPGSPYACNAPEVGRQVAGAKYAGIVTGCATPPAGKRGTYLTVGDTVARSTVTRDLDAKARRRWFAEGGAGAAEPARGRSKPEPEAGRPQVKAASAGEAASPTTIDEVRRRVVEVQRALGWTGSHPEALAEVSRRGSWVYLRIDEITDRAPTEGEAIAKVWPNYLRGLRAGVDVANAALLKALGKGPTLHRGNDGEVALMRRRLQQANDALHAASAPVALVKRESFGPGTADPRRPAAELTSYGPLTRRVFGRFGRPAGELAPSMAAMVPRLLLNDFASLLPERHIDADTGRNGRHNGRDIRNPFALAESIAAEIDARLAPPQPDARPLIARLARALKIVPAPRFAADSRLADDANADEAAWQRFLALVLARMGDASGRTVYANSKAVTWAAVMRSDRHAPFAHGFNRESAMLSNFGDSLGGVSSAYVARFYGGNVVTGRDAEGAMLLPSRNDFAHVFLSLVERAMGLGAAREAFGPGTPDPQRPKAPRAPRFGAGTPDDGRPGLRDGDPAFPDAFVAYAVRRLRAESFGTPEAFESAKPTRRFVQVTHKGRTWLLRAADGSVTASVGAMVKRHVDPASGRIYEKEPPAFQGAVVATAFQRETGTAQAAPGATIPQAYEVAVSLLAKLGLPMRRPSGLPWFEGAHSFEPKRGRSKPEPEERRASAVNSKEATALGDLLGRSAGHSHRMAGVVPLRLVRVGEKRTLAYEFAYVHDGVSEGFIIPEGVMVRFSKPPAAAPRVYMMPVLGHEGRVFNPIPDLPTLRSLLYADKPTSYDTRVVHDWQRTLAEYMAKPGAERRGTNRGGRLDAERGVWRGAVIHALRNRWPVPARVLADLPGAAQLFGVSGEAAAPEAAALEGAVDVTVGHSSEGGTYVVTPPGDLRFNAALKGLHMGFKWWDKGQRWYRGGSIGQAAPSVDLEQIANALRLAGARVRVEGVQYVDPAQARAAFAAHKAANAEKSSARAVDLLAKIDALNKEADEAEQQSHSGNTFRRREMAASKAARLRKEAEGLALKVRELAGRSVRVARDAAGGGAVAQVDRGEMRDVAQRADAAYQETRGKRDGAAGRKVAVRAAVESTGGKDFFPTPPALARFMVDVARVGPGRVVVEPSAGMGAIVDAALAAGAMRVVAVEYDRARVAYLSGRYDARVEVIEADFTHLPTASLPSSGSVLIVMNPPFTTHDDVKAYVAHITRAADFVDRGMCWGLVALAPASLLFGTDKRTAALRARIEAKGGTVEKLPAGAFKASGTAVNAVLVRYGRVAPQSEVPPFGG